MELIEEGKNGSDRLPVRFWKAEVSFVFEIVAYFSLVSGIGVQSQVKKKRKDFTKFLHK